MNKVKNSKSNCVVFRICLIVFLSFIALNTFGGTGVVNKVWMDHGAKQNGESGITVHVDFNVIGLKGNKVKVIAYFYDENKGKLKGKTSGYITSDGQVSVSRSVVPKYENTNWSDFSFFIPYLAFTFARGKHSYYVRVLIYDEINKRFIDNNNKYIAFTGTGSGNNNVKKANGKIVKPFYASGDDRRYYLTIDDNTCYWSDANGNIDEFKQVYTYRLVTGKTKLYTLYSYGHEISSIYVETDYSKLRWFFPSSNTYTEYYNVPNKGEKFPLGGKLVGGHSYYSNPSSYGGSGSSYGGSYNSGVSKTCTFCHGTGLRPSSMHESAVRYSTNRSYTYCNRCGSTHLVLDRHENCGVCQGTGRVVE